MVCLQLVFLEQYATKGIKPLHKSGSFENNWGQININLVNEWDKLGRGASSYWSTRNRSAPLPNLSHPLEINVDLTPIIFLIEEAVAQV
jgi:hypothetical protein